MTEESLTLSTTIEVFYSKGHTGVPLPPALDPLTGVLATIAKAEKSIVLGMYSFTSQPLCDALIAKMQSGLLITGVADATEAKLSTSKIRALTAAGADIKLVGSSYNLMHLKVCVIDDLLNIYGSYNWTTQAEKANDEILTVIHSRELAKVLVSQIQEIRAQTT